MLNRHLLATATGAAVMLACASCVVPNGGGNDNTSDISIAIDGGTAQASPNGTAIDLAAEAAGGTPPYVYRWSQERGPDTILVSQTGAAVTTDVATFQGEYAFRVLVTDAAGTRADRWVTVTVDRGPFQVTIEGPDTVVFDTSPQLSAVAPSEGIVTVAWTVVDGAATLEPDDQEITNIVDAELGTVRVRVEASESDTGETDDDEFTFTVVPAVTLDTPNIATIGVAEPFTAEVQPPVEGTVFAWAVTSGDGVFDDPSSAAPMFTAGAGGEIAFELVVTVPLDDGSTVDGIATGTITVLQDSVVVATDLGDIVLELDATRAPLTRNNFVAYVDEGFYDGVLMHRYSCEFNISTGECIPFVVQGGGYIRVDDGLQLKEATRDPVRSEADNGLSNVKYAVAMALTANDPDSGTTQFYINLNENTHLDGLFTVFGRVVDGFDVLDAISEIETGEADVIDPDTGDLEGTLDEVPVTDVVMETARRLQ